MTSPDLPVAGAAVAVVFVPKPNGFAVVWAPNPNPVVVVPVAVGCPNVVAVPV